MGKIIATANQKGGVGKTTTAVNLSACVADAGKRVLLIDIDPQGNASSGLSANTKKGLSVYDVLMGEAEAKEAIRKTKFKNLSVLTSSIDLSGAEIELVGVDGRESILKNALSKVRDEYDFIFIDSPPSLGLLTLNALTAADSVLVPIQCEYYALEGLAQLMDTVRRVKRQYNPNLDMEGVLLTMYDGRLNLTQQVIAEVKKFFPKKVFATPIPRSVRLAEAPSYGQPIHYYDRGNKGAKAYPDVAAELIKKNR